MKKESKTLPFFFSFFFEFSYQSSFTFFPSFMSISIDGIIEMKLKFSTMTFLVTLWQHPSTITLWRVCKTHIEILTPSPTSYIYKSYVYVYISLLPFLPPAASSSLVVPEVHLLQLFIPCALRPIKSSTLYILSPSLSSDLSISLSLKTLNRIEFSSLPIS